MTKTRLGLSIAVVLVTAILVTLAEFFYAPITGAAAVNALNGGVAEFGMAKFVQTGGLTKILNLTAVAALAVVWVPFIIKGK